MLQRWPVISTKSAEHVVHRRVMSLEPYCLSVRYQYSKTKRFRTRHYGSEEITDIIFQTNYQKSEYRPRGTLDVESVKFQWKLSETKDEDQTFSK